MAKIIPINEAEEHIGHPSQDISGRYPQDDFLRSAKPEPFSILERKGNHPAVWTRLVKGQHVRYPEADALRVAQHEHKERKLLEAGKVGAAA